MTAWHRGTLLAFDTESTGVDPTTARIVTATALVLGMNPGQIVEKQWLLNPGVPIPDEATAIQGVTTEQATAEGRNPREALPEIVGALSMAWAQGWPVIAYNAPYDLTLLDHELGRHNLPSIAQAGGPGIVIDPLVCDRRLDMYRKGKRTLAAACEFYGVRIDNAHNATDDAIAAARVAWRLAETYPQVMQDRTLEQLQADQARWQGDWAEHFETYLRTKGGQPDANVSRCWPYELARVEAAA